VLPNLAWTKRHQPDVWRRVRHALQPKDFVAYRLTGDVGTDPTGPTRSILNDWRAEDWSPETCQAAGIPREILPDVRYRPWQPRGVLGDTARLARHCALRATARDARPGGAARVLVKAGPPCPH